MKRFLPAALSFAIMVTIPSARAKDEKWVEARSPHFIVVSNAGAQQAKNTANQFEQIRETFQRSFVFTKDRPTPTITILAAKDENTLRELLPEFWAVKGHTHPAGIFIDAAYQLAIAVQLFGEGENPFQSVYHEYYHSLTMPYFPGLPVWLSEGLADFYGNSKVSDKTATLGMPSEELIYVLHQQPLIPLGTLFRVDHSSPYYNEGSKASIFYAESWALTHYLMLGDKQAHRQNLTAYLDALGHGVSQEDAAAKAFGDLGKLQKALEAYIGSAAYYEIQMPAPSKLPENNIQVRPISEAEADAYKGGFLTLHGQYKEAEPLVHGAAQLDPKLALAQQNLAIFYYLQNKPADARAALSAAIDLDPKNALTRFLRAQLSSRESSLERNEESVEGDLRAAVAADPNFAPPYGLLAMYLATKGQQLPEALEFGKKGVMLEPGNISYQMAVAQVLARMGNYDQAWAIAMRARANTIDPNNKANADQFIEYLRQVKDSPATNGRFEVSVDSGGTPPEEEERSQDTEGDVSGTPAPNDGKLRADGTVTQVQCKVQVMQITVNTDSGPVILHSADNTNIEFISDLPVQSEQFYPCTSLKGHIVKVKYLPAASGKAQPYQGEIVSVEIRK